MCTLRATAAAYEARAVAEERLASMMPATKAPSPTSSPGTTSTGEKKKKKKKKAKSPTPANGTSVPNGTAAANGPVGERGGEKEPSAAVVARSLRDQLAAGVPALEAPIKWETVRTESLRETAVVRAPKTLRFHFVRSEYTPYGQLLKKVARVSFPIFFDLAPHMSRGVEPAQGAGTTGGVQAALSGVPVSAPQRVIYRLESAILHYGYTHSSGHFVAIRRKPGAPLGVPGKGWLRVSDADVEEVGAEELAASAGLVFMLVYERIELPPSKTEELASRLEFASATPSPAPTTSTSTSTSPTPTPGPIPSTVPAGTSVDDLD